LPIMQGEGRSIFLLLIFAAFLRVARFGIKEDNWFKDTRRDTKGVLLC